MARTAPWPPGTGSDTLCGWVKQPQIGTAAAGWNPFRLLDEELRRISTPACRRTRSRSGTEWSPADADDQRRPRQPAPSAQRATSGQPAPSGQVAHRQPVRPADLEPHSPAAPGLPRASRLRDDRLTNIVSCGIKGTGNHSSTGLIRCVRARRLMRMGHRRTPRHWRHCPPGLPACARRTQRRPGDRQQSPQRVGLR